MAVSISEALERFNRKERNLLVRAILGNSETPIRLSEAFRASVAKALEIDPIDKDAWWATDYHFDWLAGALAVYLEGEDALRKPRPNRPKHDDSNPSERCRLVKGNQEDVDLIIANGTDLILIEAKAYGTWSNGPMTSKLARLELLQAELNALSDKAATDKTIRLHLLLISPRPPQKLKAWTQWLNKKGQIPWIELELSLGNQSILDVSRCDQAGKEMVSTEYWCIDGIKPSS